jgi:hypothetical protein
VTVSKTTNLALAGETVNVSVTNIPDGQGIYVYQCASVLISPRPGSAMCRSGMTESLWLTTNGGQGAGIASQQNQLSLVREFTIGSTTFDCSIDTCSVFVRRDHMGGSTDFTLDTIVPISFASEEETVNPTSPGGEEVQSARPTPKLSKKFSREIAFNSGSSKLGLSAKSNIKKKIADYRLASTITITATAGMSSGVSEKTVTKLAKNRATAIKKYLVQQGISASKIVIKTELVKSGKKPTTKVVATP